MPVFVGTSVSFPNNDNVRHQVYSFSPAKRFELQLYAGVPAQPIVFDKPGVVVLGCNIHDWMIGYVYVSESPYFAKTGANGKARITNLPPRAYIVRVWHPQAETQEEATRKTIDAAARTVEVEWMLKVKPEARVRRAPTGARAIDPIAVAADGAAQGRRHGGPRAQAQRPQSRDDGGAARQRIAGRVTLLSATATCSRCSCRCAGPSTSSASTRSSSSSSSASCLRRRSDRRPPRRPSSQARCLRRPSCT